MCLNALQKLDVTTLSQRDRKKASDLLRTKLQEIAVLNYCDTLRGRARTDKEIVETEKRIALLR